MPYHSIKIIPSDSPSLGIIFINYINISVTGTVLVPGCGFCLVQDGWAAACGLVECRRFDRG